MHMYRLITVYLLSVCPVDILLLVATRILQLYLHVFCSLCFPESHDFKFVFSLAPVHRTCTSMCIVWQNLKRLYVFPSTSKNHTIVYTTITLSTLGKIFSRRHLNIFSYMIWHFMQIVSIEDNLHEMSNPVFWKKRRTISPICHLLN